MATIVVTGGAGFIGSNIVDLLIKDGYQVTVLDNLVNGKREQVPAGTKFFCTDITTCAALPEVLAGADCVFHLAALPRVPYSIEHPEETYRANVFGTQRILAAARQAGVRRVVFASSSSVYGDQLFMPLSESMVPNPLSPYAAQKQMSEVLCASWARTFGISTVCLRLFNVYGPRCDPNGPYALVIGKFIRQRLAGEPLTVCGDGEQMRDFTHVSDVTAAFVQASFAEVKLPGEVINIGGGNPTSVNRIAELVGGPVEHIAARSGEPRNTHANIKKAEKLLKWKPQVAIEDGIADLKRSFGIV